MQVIINVAINMNAKGIFVEISGGHKDHLTGNWRKCHHFIKWWRLTELYAHTSYCL